MLLFVVLGLGLLWVAICGVLLLRAQREARDAAALLRDIKARADVAAFLDDDGSVELDRAESQFRHAANLLDSPLLAPLRVVPIAGRQVRSAHAISAAAAESLDAGTDALEKVRQVVGEGVPAGAARVSAVAVIAEASRHAADRLEAVDLGPTKGLIGPLVDARNEAAENLSKALGLLDDAALTSRALTRLLSGPANYVLLAANNSEMRAGSGMFLQVGALRFADGAFNLEDLTSVTNIVVPPGAVPISGDFADRWAFLSPTEEWRNLNATPRFDAVGPYAAAMWQAAVGAPAQGVVSLDPFALRAVLRSTGPIVLEDGTEVHAANVVQLLLHDQYKGIDIGDEENAQRRDRLKLIAKAAVKALGETQLNAAVLVRELIDAVHGRHLLVWSQDVGIQEAWTRVGVAGTLEEDSLAVSVLNRGANKLDQFVDVEADVKFGEASDGLRPVELRLELSNETPEGESSYVAGPLPGTTDEYGEYIGIVAVNLPGRARNGRIEGLDTPPLVVGGDGNTRVIGARYRVARGTKITVVVRFELPADHDTMRIEPSARPTPVAWTIGDRHYEDDRAHDVPIR